MLFMTNWQKSRKGTNEIWPREIHIFILATNVSGQVILFPENTSLFITKTTIMSDSYTGQNTGWNKNTYAAARPNGIIRPGGIIRLPRNSSGQWKKVNIVNTRKRKNRSVCRLMLCRRFLFLYLFSLKSWNTFDLCYMHNFSSIYMSTTSTLKYGEYKKEENYDH